MLLSNEEYIIRRRGEYLMGKPYDDTTCLRFSNSPYDAWHCKDFNAVIVIAKQVGGKVFAHNRLTGDIRGGWK